jgi:signal transduction histidine kinase
MSIRLKLTIYWAAVLGAIMLIAAFLVFALFEREQWHSLDAALLEEADTAAAAIAHAGQTKAATIVRRLSEERDLGPNRRVRLIAGDEIIADFGDPGADLPVLGQVPAKRGMLDGSRQIFRFAVMPFTLAGRSVYLEDGADAITVRTSIKRLRDILIPIVPLLLALCVAGGYWLAGRALVPITSLTAALAEMGPRNLSRRLTVAFVRDEVARLTAVINALLDRLESASLAERRFASDAAHELRTPLTVLRTGLEVALGRERTREENREALDAALQEVLKLCKMADELLALARLDGEASVQRVPLNLRSVVEEVIAAVAPLAQAKDLTLRISNESDAPVEGSPVHLRRLLINLLDNALKFTPEHGVVSVSLERNREHAKLRVADSGPGIAQADLPFVFERFYRGAAAEGDGSGLGLSLCKEIVRLYGGEITAGNMPEGGSEFVVTLPLAHRADALGAKTH